MGGGTLETAPAEPSAAAAQLSVRDLFTIGIGPSSSHTVGPMRAARSFAETALAAGAPVEVRCGLFGSLALTGKGHMTDVGVLLGLSGIAPEAVDPAAVPALVAAIRDGGELRLGGRLPLGFREPEHLVFRRGEFLPGHSNALRFEARFADGAALTRTYFSVGGGAVVEADAPPALTNVSLAHPFASAAELVAAAASTGKSIADIVRANEAAWRPAGETEAFLDQVRQAMLACIYRGCEQDGVLPGGLGVRRRAKALRLGLEARAADPSAVFEWVSLWALAVNEENAAGARVVTAPTNGAAGVLPAVLKYYETFTPRPSLAGARDLLLTAAAIGMLYKTAASISAAEVGCQGEVGVACSMAAAGLTAALGGAPAQVENAAEIGMEHNLGLTCDPIGGLVQIPCIERNAMGAVKAVTAAQLALRGDGRHLVSLDAVIATMRQTGRDMQSKYKETSLGGLAVNVAEC
jgi:L-serine dehydratase